MSIKIWNTASILATNHPKQPFSDSMTNLASAEKRRFSSNSLSEEVAELVPNVATVMNAHIKPISALVALESTSNVEDSEQYHSRFATGGCDGCIKIWGMALIDYGSVSNDAWDGLGGQHGHTTNNSGTGSSQQVVSCVRTIYNAHTDAVWRLCVLSGGKYLLSAGYKKDCRLRVWDVNSGSCIATMNGHSEATYALIELPNGAIASGGGDEFIKLWNVSSSLATDTDEKKVVCLNTLMGHGGKVLALECVRDEVAQIYGAGDNCFLLVSGNQDGIIRLWGMKLSSSPKGIEFDTKLGANSVAVAAGDDLPVERATLRGHEGEVNCLRAFADGIILASGSDDKTIRLWNLETCSCIKVLSGHQNWIFGLQVLGDSETLVSSSRDQTIGFWQIPRKRFPTRKMSMRK
jgi:WD40 repeat protein